MGLDIGDFDVLRDKDGRLYVVDAAKTPFGPPIGMNEPSMVLMVQTIAGSFRRQFLEPSKA